MNALLLILIPLVGAVLAALWPDNRTRPRFLPAVGFVHAVLCFRMLATPSAVSPEAWLGFDPLRPPCCLLSRCFSSSVASMRSRI